MLFQLTLRLFAWFFFTVFVLRFFQKYTYRVETFYVPYYVSALVVDTNS